MSSRLSRLFHRSDDRQPILADNSPGQLTLAYGSKDCASLDTGIDGNPVVFDYEPLKLSSFRVFTLRVGTVFENPVLLVEQIIITILFFMAASPTFIFFNHKVVENRHGTITMNEWLDTQEDKMRAFAMIMTQLAAFLLTFYTSMAVARWWTIRCEGVGGIKKAAVELEMFISQLVSQDQKILSAVRRYARASLILVVLWRRNQLAHMKQLLVGRDILEQSEADQLLAWNHCLHETIWGWQSSIISKLHQDGLIKTGDFLCFLLQRYVHLLGLLVKLHNVVIAIIMGALFGAAVRDGRTIICCQLFARTLLLPVLFNAILLINAELSDPFDSSKTSFPMTKYEKALEADCKGAWDAFSNLPDWINKRLEAAPLKSSA